MMLINGKNRKVLGGKSLTLKGEGRIEHLIMVHGSPKTDFFGIVNCITFSLSGRKESDQTLNLWAPLPLLSSVCVWTG